MASKSIAKRPDGQWRARYRAENGREHAKHFGRKTDAQRWLDEVTAAVLYDRPVRQPSIRPHHVQGVRASNGAALKCTARVPRTTSSGSCVAMRTPCSADGQCHRSSRAMCRYGSSD